MAAATVVVLGAMKKAKGDALKKAAVALNVPFYYSGFFYYEILYPLA